MQNAKWRQRQQQQQQHSNDDDDDDVTSIASLLTHCYVNNVNVEISLICDMRCVAYIYNALQEHISHQQQQHPLVLSFNNCIIFAQLLEIHANARAPMATLFLFFFYFREKRVTDLFQKKEQKNYIKMNLSIQRMLRFWMWIIFERDLHMALWRWSSAYVNFFHLVKFII